MRFVPPAPEPPHAPDNLADDAGLHREFAVSCFNGAWDLIDSENRTAADDTEMLLLSMTSRWHWAHAGGPEQIATGDWQVSHVASLLGLGDLALRFAQAALEAATAEGWDGWRLASMHEGMARALSVTGDAEGRDWHIAMAEEALSRETDEEDRRIIADQLATID